MSTTTTNHHQLLGRERNARIEYDVKPAFVTALGAVAAFAIRPCGQYGSPNVDVWTAETLGM